jgi:hypothetical protein
MHYAIVDNKLVEAKPGLIGLCPGCSQPVTAKCGTQRIHHWAHGNNKTCDSWWESETEWHRSWKNNFPAEWQEIFLPDELTGEKHIADVCTDQGLVIEFQHSHIDPEQRTTREKFYKTMIWVVDGMRLKGDYNRFLKSKDFFQTIKKGIFKFNYPEECFPTEWIGSSVAVIFDFRKNESKDNHEDIRNHLYCLFPMNLGSSSICAEIPRKAFLSAIIDGTWLLRYRNFMDNVSIVNQEWQHQKELQRRQRDNINFERFSRAFRYQQLKGRF